MIFITIRIFVLIISVMLHELAHGFVALVLGDDTAKKAGRLTFNPIKHLDLVGSVIFPAILAITHSPVMFGWAKPVPIDMSKVKDSKKHIATVSIVGPLTNVSLAVIGVLLLWLLRVLIEGKYGQDLYQVFLMINDTAKMQLIAADPLLFIAIEVFMQLVFINTALAVVNLVPIPPLDGSRLLFPFLNKDQEAIYNKLEKYGILLIFLLLYMNVLDPIFNFVFGLVIQLII